MKEDTVENDGFALLLLPIVSQRWQMVDVISEISVDTAIL